MAIGAVDNAAGCPIMMEASRLIRSLGLHPRRSIRVVLWLPERKSIFKISIIC
ncbi:M28 family peptidase [Gluconobacter wancherniae]|uniref:M28 family peptidase n=1 Tax=Gluconobacter wancherniae TaxID=1307955 RepID=UPI0038D240F7